MTYDSHAAAEAETGSPFLDPDQIAHHAIDREHELELRIADLQRQLADAHEHAARTSGSEQVITSFDELGEGELAALVGEETAKVLAAARNAAAGIMANAERTAAEMRAKADRDAERLAADADAMLERRAQEADIEATRRLEEADTAIGLALAEAEQQALELRTGAEAAVADIQALAQRRVDDAAADAMRITDAARAEATGLVERAAAEGRALVVEAQEVRARMLEDLLRRRKLLRRQVEQLHAGRERLANAFGVVHDSMRSIDAELSGVLAEAKAAAEQAAARAEVTSDAATDELRVMVDESRAAAGLDEEPDAPGADGPERGDDGRDDDVTGEDDRLDAGAGGDPASSLFTRLKAVPALEAPNVEDDRPGRDEPAPLVSVPGSEPTDVSSTVREPTPVFAAGDQPISQPADDGSSIGRSEADAASIVEEPTAGEVGVTDALTVERDRLLDDLSRSVVRKMKRQLSDEQNDLLDAVRRQRPLPPLDELLAPESEHIRRYAEGTLPALRNAALAGHELPAALHAGRPGGPGAAAKTAKRQGVAATAHATKTAGDISVRDLAAALAVDVVGALRGKLEECMAGPSAETLRLAPAGPGSSGGTTTKAARSAAGDELCDQVRLAYREVRNRKVDGAVGHAVRHALARGIRNAPAGAPAELVSELLVDLPTG